MKVLVADDDSNSADALATSLRLAGHQVETAYDGTSALGKAQAFRPEAAILDICMADKSGFEVARQMRLLHTLRPGCLIAMTGESAHSELTAGREAEFDYFLIKPASPKQVAALLSLRSVLLEPSPEAH
jgi:DNA-binding response OmpR family regulator